MAIVPSVGAQNPECEGVGCGLGVSVELTEQRWASYTPIFQDLKQLNCVLSDSMHSLVTCMWASKFQIWPIRLEGVPSFRLANTSALCRRVEMEASFL